MAVIKVLRWVALLPLAFGLMVLTGVLCAFGIEAFTRNVWVVNIVAGAVGGAVFIFTGWKLAPLQTYMVRVVLAVLTLPIALFTGVPAFVEGKYAEVAGAISMLIVAGAIGFSKDGKAMLFVADVTGFSKEEKGK